MISHGGDDRSFRAPEEQPDLIRDPRVPYRHPIRQPKAHVPRGVSVLVALVGDDDSSRIITFDMQLHGRTVRLGADNRLERTPAVKRRRGPAVRVRRAAVVGRRDSSRRDERRWVVSRAVGAPVGGRRLLLTFEHSHLVSFHQSRPLPTKVSIVCCMSLIVRSSLDVSGSVTICSASRSGVTTLVMPAASINFEQPGHGSRVI